MPSININITINEQECQSLLKNQEAMKALYAMLRSLESVFPIATSTTTATEESKESKTSYTPSIQSGVENLVNTLFRGALKGAESAELKTITETLTTLFSKK